MISNKRAVEADVFRFPISLLTACALFEGIVKTTLTGRQNELQSESGQDTRRNTLLRKVTMKKVNNVLLDIQELLGYSPVSVTFLTRAVI